MSKLIFRKDIQGLRAIAVLLVIVYHYNQKLLPGGYIGVDVFFVISGFLVTQIIKNKLRNQQFSLVSFYLSRFNRILPSYLFMLVVSTVFSAIILTRQDFLLYHQSLKQALFFNSNHYFSNFGSYFAPKTYELPLLHTWSLSVEMKFYCILPFILIATSRIADKTIRPYIWLITASIFIITSILINWTSSSSYAYFHLATRSAEFIIGALITFQYNKKSKKNSFYPLAGLVLILTASLLYTGKTHFPGIMAILPCAGAYLIICSHTPSSYITQLLSTKIMVQTGRLSYQLYLWHWPILALLKYYKDDYQLTPMLTALFILLTIFLSLISHAAFEKNYKQLNGKAWPIFFKLILPILLLLPLSSHINTILSPQIGVELMRYADSSKICHGNIKSNCSVGSQNSQKKALLLGDSHGAQLHHFFDYLGKKQNFKTTLLTASSCITYSGFDSSHIPDYSLPACKQQIKYASTQLKKYKTIYLAGMWSYHIKNNTHTLETLEKFIEKQKGNHQLILIGQVPQLQQNVRRFTRFKYIGLPARLKEDQQYKQTNTAILRLAIKYKLQYIDIASNEIFKQGAFFNSTPIYFDKSHLNEYGVKLLAKSLSEKSLGEIRHNQKTV